MSCKYHIWQLNVSSRCQKTFPKGLQCLADRIMCPATQATEPSKSADCVIPRALKIRLTAPGDMLKNWGLRPPDALGALAASFLRRLRQKAAFLAGVNSLFEIVNDGRDAQAAART